MIEVQAYTPSFDIDRRQALLARGQEVSENHSYVKKQVETLIAERFNVLLNKFNYEVKEGQLFGESMAEPALESFRKGRDYRRRIGEKTGKTQDFEREEADVVGFSKIQRKMVDPATPEGTILLSISPKGREGSIYQHNFYDVFIKKAGYVEARRYSSALSPEDYKRRLGLEGEWTDSDFISNPLDVSAFFGTPDDVHRYLHEEHEYMSEDVFRERIIKDAAPFIANYARTLDVLYLNAALNVADESQRRHSQGIEAGISFSESSALYFGNQEVRTVAAGCGRSGGFGQGGIASVFRVSEFANMQEWFKCPKCNYQADGPVGNECPSCGITKEKYAEESAEVC